jgi:apoptosis-inducing factor 3
VSKAESRPPGPDLRAGVPEDQIKDHGMLLGHVDGEPVLLIRRGAVVHAISATCSHHAASLADGLLVGDTIRCPLHHACFEVRTGQALRAPALAKLPTYEVERRLDLLIVRGRLDQPQPAGQTLPRRGRTPTRIVIVGAGGAGAAAALTLRQEGFLRQLTLIGDESAEPYDRPNLSKDYLAGTAPEEWLPLTPKAAYEEHGIRLVLGTPVVRIDSVNRVVSLRDGRTFPYDALLLATGATPVRLQVPGVDRAHVHQLRSLEDARAIRACAALADTAVVVGTGFMGLEVAAALRQLGLEVHVIGRERRPLEQVLGAELGLKLQRRHEAAGVAFHFGATLAEIKDRTVRLQDGSTIRAGLVVVAVGVRPNTALPSSAGAALDRGVLVNHLLETSVPGIYAAGDVARWPDPRSGEPVRFEHWATAQRQGQTAARNMLGRLEAFQAVPFFWTEHYDLRVNYVGHASAWDRLEVQTGLPDGEWEQRYYTGNALTAVATIGRDQRSLAAELALEQDLLRGRSSRAPATAPALNPGGVR